jgi:hypothetical protein
LGYGLIFEPDFLMFAGQQDFVRTVVKIAILPAEYAKNA